jgi:hypothetical protein
MNGVAICCLQTEKGGFPFISIMKCIKVCLSLFSATIAEYLRLGIRDLLGLVMEARKP